MHGNAVALEAAFAMMGAGEPCVFIGDLLTYGCDPQGVIDLMRAELLCRPFELVLGNHDQMYRDLELSASSDYLGLPGWISRVCRLDTRHRREP